LEKHQKHNNLSRSTHGNYARCEIAVLGTNCSNIKQLFTEVKNLLPAINFAVLEADHQASEQAAYASNLTDKIAFMRYDSQLPLNNFDIRQLHEATDILLVNGNHFEANCQIAVIDEQKPLEKKLHKLTDVQLVITKTGTIPSYFIEHLAGHTPAVINWGNWQALAHFFQKKYEENIPKLNGLVLAGGQSQRMGTDKGLLNYHGSEQRLHTANLLASYCQQVYISLNSSQADSYQGPYPTLTDQYLNCGPLAGILTAFRHNPNTAWLVLACDLPYINQPSLAQITSQRNPQKLATAFQSSTGGFPEPLATIYEPRAYPKLLQMLSYGYDCPRKALINSNIQLLQATQSQALLNINTTAEYEQTIINISPKLAL
jgi:molybdenum cofactor guanylyltransferase